MKAGVPPRYWASNSRSGTAFAVTLLTFTLEIPEETIILSPSKGGPLARGAKLALPTLGASFGLRWEKNRPVELSLGGERKRSAAISPNCERRAKFQLFVRTVVWGSGASSKTMIRCSSASLFPSTCVHERFRDKQVPITHTPAGLGLKLLQSSKEMMPLANIIRGGLCVTSTLLTCASMVPVEGDTAGRDTAAIQLRFLVPQKRLYIHIF